MPKIIFLYGGENLAADAESNSVIAKEFEYSGKVKLYEAFVKVSPNYEAQNSYHFPCGGIGTCRKCKAKVTSGIENISPPSPQELKYLTQEELNGGVRFICMCEAWGDVTVSPHSEDISGGGMSIQISGMQSQSLKTSGGTDNLFGVAVDIGTTTVAVYLCDLADGRIIEIIAGENPQRIYGADVISRINHTIENKDGLKALKKSILSLIFKLIGDLCKKNGIAQRDIKKIVLTGNTVMQHIAAGISPKSIAFAPFTAPTLFDYDISLGELLDGTDLTPDISHDASVYFPLAIASYVGGDITTGIIASDTDLTEKTRLFLDIGTNGEMGIGSKGGFIFCATAAGPAFEGATIKQGLPGVNGAVSKVYIDSGNALAYTVIGDSAPRGICGSGIIDIAALMLEIGAVDETGRIIDADEVEDIDGDIAEKYRSLYDSLDEVDGENVFYIDRKFNIYITQKDIREIQLAKAAVCAGIMTLLHYSGKLMDDIDEVILAGGFGTKIDTKSACRIGLIPAALEAKITAAGNTAGMGAVAALIDSDAKARISNLKSVSKYIELSGDAFFMDEYIEKMMF